MTISEAFSLGVRWVRRLTSTERGEFVVDMFAGGGGTSVGIKAALGRDADVALNHDSHAIAIHKLNHPKTHHFLCDVREVDPRQVMADRPIGLLWLSPDCTHHSRAKGGKPAKRNRRALANVGTVWAAARRPRVIILENVEEFEGWGPLDDQGQPLKDKKGQSFKRWVGKLRKLGYEVQWRSLVAADYGAPTIRKRLFLIARCDGKKIVWPAPTHSKTGDVPLLGLKAWRAAYECIDWGIPARSIFERKKDLAEATQRRIHAGILKYVFSGDPFIVLTNHSGEGFRGQSVDTPLNTVTGSRDFGAVVSPLFSGVGGRAGQSPSRTPKDPLRTITGKKDDGLVLPFLSPYYSPNAETDVRAHDLRQPQPTIPSRNNTHALASASLMAIDNQGEWRPQSQSAKEPLRTITTENRHALVESFLVKFKGKQGPKDLRKPLDGMTTKPSDGIAAAFLAKHYTGVVGSDMRKPKGTITARDHDSLVTGHLTTFRGTSKAGRDLRDPVPSLTAGGNHVAEVRAFLVKYFRTGVPRSIRRPAPTLTAKHRFGLVEVHGQQYQIEDICLRMLTPRELLRAQFGKYADGYQLIGNQEKQVKAIGNSVPPEVAEALVRANVQLN